ncbi:hypothetical protein [Glycomyces buryatensis]|uniref:Uncharacterized protein n=1 Tax=Glycomyces buryatensis TaxID=2570927 RepID=A0A4S8QE94_9ACTN|nr:hypothetical protein [Glycomyces buryatensis]THV41412.1 hypothetical protein FAB82_11470 [Glycomyces buryatensis]
MGGGRGEVEEAEFPEPARTWTRVGALVGGWVLLLALGGWVAPGFASGGSTEDTDPRDEAPTDAVNAAARYLRFGSNNDASRAEDTLCDGASPELTAGDLDVIRETYGEELGGISDIDVSTDAPVASADGISIAATVTYISQGGQRPEEFTVTVQEDGDSFCVYNAVQLEPEPTDEPGSEVDPEALASDFIATVVRLRDSEAAAEYQCDTYTGPTPDDLISAIAEWEALNSDATGEVLDTTLVEDAEAPITMVNVETELKAFNVEAFAFTVGVQGDCVDSLEDVDGLLDVAED